MLLGLDVRLSQKVLRMLPSMMPYKISLVEGRTLSASAERLEPEPALLSLPEVPSMAAAAASVRLRTSSRTP